MRVISDEPADRLATTEAGGAAIRGGTLRIGVFCFNVLLSVGSAALLFRHLGVRGTGYYYIVLSIVAVVSAVSDLGLTILGIRELSLVSGPARGQIVGNLMGLRVTLTVVGVAVGMAFAAVVGYQSRIVLGVLVAGAGILLQSLQDGLTISLLSRLKLGWVAVLDLLRQLLTVGLIIALVVGNGKLVSFLAVPIPVGVVVLALAAYLVRDDVRLRPRFERAHWRRLIGAVLPYSAAVALGAVYFRVAIIALSLISPAQQVGYFATSFRVIEVLITIPALLVGAAFPIFSRSAHDDEARLAYATGRVFEVSVIVGVWLALSLVLGANVIVMILGGRGFDPAAGVLRLQSISLVAIFVGTVWNMTLLSLGRYGDVLRVSAIALGAGLVLVVAGAELDGARGVAIAVSITELGVCLLSGRAVMRTRPRLMPSLRVLPRVALPAAVASLLELVPGVTAGAPQVGLVVLGTLVYGAGVLLSGAVPDEVVAELRSRRHVRDVSRQG